MKTSPLNPDYLIQNEDELRALFPPTHELAAIKALDHIDAHARQFIERSPFLCIGTQRPDGQADVSPRGDPNGFVKILDETTILIPDRPGNNRLDTQANIVAHPDVGILFMIPGFDETLRVNGHAVLTRDPDLMALMAVHDRPPRLAIAVTVQEVFFHCAKAFRRSKLWDVEVHQDRKEMASLMQILLEQTGRAVKDAEEQAQMDARLEEGYKASMY